MKIETAIISVSDKTNLVMLAKALTERGIRILSTGGTARTLEEAGIEVEAVSEHTGSPEILDGRVKTLHPKIHGGILARHDDESHQSELEQQSIAPIGLVVVNLYPFQQTVARQGVSLEEAVEQIDIGGPTMVRAAAKNHRYISVVVDPGDYASLLEELEKGDGETSLDFRRNLALKAFRHTASYDAAIASHLTREFASEEGPPESLHLSLARQAELRYGENPHQRAALYREGGSRGLVAAEQLQGKQLSFNNYLDLEAARNLCREFERPACVIVKHSNPCGVAQADGPLEAFQRALECDPLSAFGSIIAFNRLVDLETAQAMPKLFVEAVIAAGFSDGALELFAAKKNLRVMLAEEDEPAEYDFKKIAGGFLVQEADRRSFPPEDLETVTQRIPDESEVEDLLFAWKVCKHVKSNAIVLAKDRRTVGIGAGQMSRVDSVTLAARKAKLPLQGCAMASDAFFPFRDGIDEAAQAGVTAVIQPGGSKRDKEVVEAADEHSMAMLFTAMRHFRH